MATIALVRDGSGGFGVAVGWTPLVNGDDGQAWDTQDFRAVSIQVLGTFGTGGTLVWEGSNEITPTAWHTLEDPQGNALSFSAAGVEQVEEVTRWMRPRVPAGDGTTSLDVRLWAGRTR